MSELGTLIDKLYDLREEKRKKEEEITEIQKSISVLETQLLDALQGQKLSRATGTKATISISEIFRPQVEDWEAFYSFIHQTQYFHLLERRPSSAGCLEVLELLGRIPGVAPRFFYKLSLRKL